MSDKPDDVYERLDAAIKEHERRDAPRRRERDRQDSVWHRISRAVNAAIKRHE